MKDRITGRYLAEDIEDPETGEILIKKNHMITPKRAEIIEKLHRVTPKDLLDCANKYFTDDYILSVIKP